MERGPDIFIAEKHNDSGFHEREFLDVGIGLNSPVLPLLKGEFKPASGDEMNRSSCEIPARFIGFRPVSLRGKGPYRSRNP
jgi:hypothetical protein